MKKRALIVYGGWAGHDPKGVAETFKNILETENFDVELSDSLDAFCKDLTVYDLLIPIWTMGDIPTEAEQNVCKAVKDGVGIAGCHGGMCDAFRNHVDWQFMTGAQWVAHPGNIIDYRVDVKRGAASPIVQDIPDFDVTSEQYYILVDPAVQVLATTRFVYPDCPQSANGPVDLPVVYTKLWGKGRVFYNSLGHDRKIFDIPEARELMRRGFLWASR